MPALNHVCVWSPTGWKRVTAEEIAKENPYGGVSAHSRILMCELCGQYVSLAKGPKVKPYFKHSRAEDDKNCQERTFASSEYYRNYDVEAHDLPMRIVYTLSSVNLELGFVSIEDELKEKYRDNSIYILPDRGEKTIEFSFNRLIPNGVSYLNVGKPAVEYRIFIKHAHQEFKRYWPETVKGVDRRGTLFDGKTRKRLPYDADVEVNHDYLLLIGGSKHINYEKQDVSIQVVAGIVSGDWRVLKVSALKLSEMSARFFLQFHVRLTSEPVQVVTLWPSCMKTPYLIHYNDPVLYILLKGNVTPHFFPSSVHSKVWKASGQDLTLLAVSGNSRQQILSVGRANALKYTYLWKECLQRSVEPPSIILKDIKGGDLSEDRYSEVPVGNSVLVESKLDGTAVFIKDGFCIREDRIIAGESTLLGDIQLGMQIRFLIGNDCVRKIYFSGREVKKGTTIIDQVLLNRLRHAGGGEVPVDHSAAAMARYLTGLPESRKWFLEHIIRGNIHTDALRIIKNHIRNSDHALQED